MGGTLIGRSLDSTLIAPPARSVKMGGRSRNGVAVSRYTRSVHRGRVVTALAGQWGAIAPRIVGLLVLAVGVGLLTGPWWSSTLPAGDRPLVAPQKMLEELRGLDGNGYREVLRRMELRPVALGYERVNCALQIGQAVGHGRFEVAYFAGGATP